jgi:hypothetical protein
MRKLNVLEFMSLDGVIQSPTGPKEDTSGGLGGRLHILTLFLKRR